MSMEQPQPIRGVNTRATENSCKALPKYTVEYTVEDEVDGGVEQNEQISDFPYTPMEKVFFVISDTQNAAHNGIGNGTHEEDQDDSQQHDGDAMFPGAHASAQFAVPETAHDTAVEYNEPQ